MRLAAGASLSVHHAWALHTVMRSVSHFSHGMHVSLFTWDACVIIHMGCMCHGKVTF